MHARVNQGTTDSCHVLVQSMEREGRRGGGGAHFSIGSLGSSVLSPHAPHLAGEGGAASVVVEQYKKRFSRRSGSVEQVVQ